MPTTENRTGAKMQFALMLREFDGLKEGDIYPIVDTLVDDGYAVVDLNKGRGKQALRCIPPEFYERKEQE